MDDRGDRAKSLGLNSTFAVDPCVSPILSVDGVMEADLKRSIFISTRLLGILLCSGTTCLGQPGISFQSAAGGKGGATGIFGFLSSFFALATLSSITTGALG